MSIPVHSIFSDVELAPRDPILGLNEQFNADPNPAKVNLGVGVYTDEQGKLPLLRCVAEVEQRMAATPKPRGYLPIDGIAAYDRSVQALLFGADADAVKAGRIATVQTLGGTGGLKVGADFLKRVRPDAQVLISDPSWENHRALFEGAGFKVRTYPYAAAQGHGIDFAGMREALLGAAPGSIVVLHACCHNPTGYDLTAAQWKEVAELLVDRRLVPFVDIAYQGFGLGLAQDRAAVQLLMDTGIEFFVATSFSKSFSLYGERVGALSVFCAAKDDAVRVLSQLKRVIRANYSNPPTHGGSIVATVLGSDELRSLWKSELETMRLRILQMRGALVAALKARGLQTDFGFMTAQRGMFSYSGLNAAQMERMRTEFGVYGVGSGRLCIAALHQGNLESVASAIAAVVV